MWSTRRIRYAPALPSAPKRPGSTIHRWSRPAVRRATAPTMCAAVIDHRRRRQARLARRRLCPGRVEDHQPADHECRPALRPDVAIYRRQSAEPAAELHLQAVREHHVPRRLRALLHAAGAGRGGAGQYRPVQQHHRSAECRPGQRSGAAGAVALFRRRRRSENTVRLLRAGVARLLQPRSRPRCLLQDR